MYVYIRIQIKLPARLGIFTVTCEDINTVVEIKMFKCEILCLSSLFILT